jgi:DNA (cytosine-5)-methyltransferase 1
MRVVDLFSGVGGLALGFRQAGFSITAAVELDARRAAVYKQNISPREVVNADVREVSLDGYKDVDGIIAGPPCQPYSRATPAGRRGIRHPYYGLDLEVIRAARQVNPRFIVIEEVPAWKPNIIISGLQELGYRTHAEVYDMSMYGIPIRRRRWIVVALKAEHANGSMAKLNIQAEPPPRPIDLLRGLPQEPCGEGPCTYNGAIIYNHVNYSINSRIRELIPKIPPGHSLTTAHKAGIIDASKYVKDVSRKHSYWLYRVHPVEPMPTVPHPRRSMLLHPIYDRMITVRELARLFTFPDWFDFRPLSIDGMYRAIADSVPPKFARKLAEALLRALAYE